MDENNRRIEKIYSRNIVKIPKIQFFFSGNKLLKNNVYGKNDINSNKNITKMVKIFTILTIAFIVANTIINAIHPIIDKQCVNTAKAIATKISNEQATIVMSNYKYDDLVNVTKDENGSIKMISANIITVNKIISDIPILIQEELNKKENDTFSIPLGSFTGIRLLSGRGPSISIKISSIGNIETDLKSEFTSAGINQTVHRIYLDVKCNVTILTPYNTIDEDITNQVLLAEGIIVGTVPNTYYNFDGINQSNLLDVVE